jgi:hypothetical protein
VINAVAFIGYIDAWVKALFVTKTPLSSFLKNSFKTSCNGLILFCKISKTTATKSNLNLRVKNLDAVFRRQEKSFILK